eukprot:COSAG03_NODE_3270_length_2115_cov_57.634921_3_plen_116_part_00
MRARAHIQRERREGGRRGGRERASKGGSKGGREEGRERLTWYFAQDGTPAAFIGLDSELPMIGARKPAINAAALSCDSRKLASVPLPARAHKGMRQRHRERHRGRQRGRHTATLV